MRPTTGVSLLAVWLLAGTVRADPPAAAAAAEGRGVTRSTEANGPDWVVVVSGYGATRADAEQVALEEARDRVVAYLRQRAPSLRWVPSVEDLRRWNAVSVTGHRANLPSPRIGPHHEIEVRVEVKNETFQRVLLRDREERVGERHLMAAKLLAALVALLAVAAGYFRLEELTRGYYTGSLRVLALACVALVGVGLWLIV